MNRSVFWWEKSFTTQLMRLALPIALQSIVSTSMQMADNLMIGQLGDIPFAAVSQVNRITFLFQVMMFGVVSGASIFVAQYWGRRDVSGVRKTLGIASIVALIVAAVLGVPAIFAPASLARVMLKSEETVQYGAQYLAIMGFVYFLQAQSLVQSAVLKSTEQVKLPAIASTIAVSVDLVLNYVLIFDHGSFGGYGVRGAAASTLVGAALELILLRVFARRYQLATAAKFREMYPVSLENVRKFLFMALPVLFNETLWALGTVTYSAVYGRIGDGVTASAAMGIFNTFDQIVSIAIRALCHACGVMVGMALGAGEHDRARLYGKRFLFVTPVAMQLLALMILPLRGVMVGLFPVSAETAKTAMDLMALFTCIAWSNAINCVVIVSVLRTGGDVRAAALIDVAPLWLIGVPVVALTGLVLKWDVRFVYMASNLEQLVKTYICIRRMREEKWVRTIGGAQGE